MGTELSFSLIVATSAYVFKLVRGWVKSLHLLTCRTVLKLRCSKANQKNYWVGWARSLELHRLGNDAQTQFLHPQNEVIESELFEELSLTTIVKLAKNKRTVLY
jgi:hypothetical protein